MQIKKAFWKESRGRSTMEQFKETEEFMRSCISSNFMKEAQCLKCKYSMCFVHEKSENSFFFCFFLNHERIMWRKHIQRFDIVRMWWKNCRMIDCPLLTQCRTFFQQTQQCPYLNIYAKKAIIKMSPCHFINKRTLSQSKWKT